jgi:mevalonate kinase
VKAIAPGKLILSGEHAVVYGRPALAMAIDRCATSIITPGPVVDTVSFDLVDLQSSDSFTMRALADLKQRVLKNYHMFLNGELGIREVLHKPIELFEFAFITILDGLHLKLPEGLNIRTQSNIPIGCGMGSSAATVLSVLRAIGHYFRVEFRPDWYMKYSLEAEKLQHGHPSGVDTYISLHGGCALFRDGEAKSVPLPRMRMHLVQTGVPVSTTGECVVAVRDGFKNDVIWNDFEAATLAVEEGLRRNSRADVIRAVRENHRLLCRIGVVPQRVQEFIADVETRGGAAKICGAGSVEGTAGGIVAVFSDAAPAEACAKFGYTMLPVRGDPLGTRIV